MSPFHWATAERASRLLRLLILVLLVLVPLAAIYALSVGGAGRDVMYLRDEDGILRLHADAPGTRHEVIVQCATTNGNRKCTRTERDLKPGEQPDTPKTQLPAPPQHSGFIKADFSVAGDPELDPAAQVVPLPPQLVVRSRVDAPPPGAGDVALSVLSLLFVLGILFNIERLLKAFEQGSVFAEATVRRLQLVGLSVAALGFLPQVDIFALLRNAALSLVGPDPVGPLPLVAGGGINIAMVLAGVFTVLIARIVHEANALAEDVRGTV
ncbi:MAG: DUF2975 domain-containing protein [Rhizomicrobium sp.]